MISFPKFLETMSKRDLIAALNKLTDAVNRMQTPRVAAPLQTIGGVLSLNGMSFKRIAARLTGVSEVSGQYQYTFIEQEYDATTGVYSDMTVGGLVGDGTSIYATELNNTDVTETMSPLTPTPAAGTGPFVWLKWKGQVDGVAVFEFNLGGGSGSSLAVYNGDTEIDGAVTQIDSDENSVLTWSEIAAGQVQFVVASATTDQDGVVTTVAQTFGGAKTFTDNVVVDGALSVGSNADIAGIAVVSGGCINLNNPDIELDNGVFIALPNAGSLPGSQNIAIGTTVYSGCSFLAVDATNGASDLLVIPPQGVIDPNFPAGAVFLVSGVAGEGKPVFGVAYLSGSGDVPVGYSGVYGTGGGGDTFSGGICTALGSSPLSVSLGGTGTTDPSLVAGSNITITGTWPNQTIAASGGGGGTGVTSLNSLTGGLSIAAAGGSGLTVTPSGSTITLGLSNGTSGGSTPTGSGPAINSSYSGSGTATSTLTAIFTLPTNSNGWHGSINIQNASTTQDLYIYSTFTTMLGQTIAEYPISDIPAASETTICLDLLPETYSGSAYLTSKGEPTSPITSLTLYVGTLTGSDTASYQWAASIVG